jgi:hypothetical protein
VASNPVIVMGSGRLAGLAINAIWHVKWADPIAALVILPLIV